MPSYPVKKRLNHDMNQYEAGDTVEMPEETAAGLIGLNVLGEQVTPPTDDEIIARIAEAATVDDVTALVGKIKRKAILDAADKRRAELTQ